MADVARGVHDKLVRRHPHVFGDVVADDAGDGARATGTRSSAPRSSARRVFDGVADVAAVAGVRRRGAAQGREGRLRLAGRRRRAAEDRRGGRRGASRRRRAATRHAVDEELGDLLFAVVNVARHLDVEPEAALRAAAQKFRGRFEAVERAGRASAASTCTQPTSPTLDALWDEVKRTG